MNKIDQIVEELLCEGKKPVIVKEVQRTEKIWICPHCNEEILEKHIYHESGKIHHSDCKGEIEYPEPTAEQKAWLESLRQK